MISLTLSRRAAASTASVAVACAAAALAPLRADAQILRVPKHTSEPAVWVGLGIGYYQMNAVADGRTETGWRFGSGVQYRGSLEYAISHGSSIGVAGTYAHLPLRYVFLSDAAAAPYGGVASLDAHADVTSLMATFHSGGGEGFHYLLDFGAGVTRFAKFTADGSGNAPLAPTGDTDFSFSIGTGFGYSPRKTMELFIVQDYGNAIHQRDGLSNDARTNNQQLTTRIGARFGAGARRSR
ncbi:MAG TPA: outer membrane beta-barrel protein [Gemmatimonadaceae bacterium]|nr:outer membrane beta-barrel protein [Gemmatimonadaceae bacterium]